MPKSEKVTFSRIDEDLENCHKLDFKISSDKLVFFSDIHKGTKKKNDAFKQNEAIYCIALDHYFENDFKLVQVGDIEEGWGFKIGSSLKKYENSVLKFESKFVNCPEGGRYFRIYGNHDARWRKPGKVNSILKPKLTNDPGLELLVKPSLKLGDKIVVLHGQQGSIESDIFWKVSRGIVRFVTSVIFRTFGRKKKRAANNPMVRHERDILLNSWATKNNKLLIAGHTHKFLFGDKHSIKSVYDNLEKLSRKQREDLSDIERLLIEDNVEEYKDQFLKNLSSFKQGIKDFDINENCYFNIGAGIYLDGITCIEIDKGKIKLLWWSNSRIQTKVFSNVVTGSPILGGIEPVVLFSESLKDVLDKI